MDKIRVKHLQWGIGTKIYDLSGGFEWYVHFDDYGPLKIRSEDCSIIQTNSNDDDVNKLIQEIMVFVKSSDLGVTKNQIMKKFSYNDQEFNEIIQKVLRVKGFHTVNPLNDSEDIIIRFQKSETEDVIKYKKMMEAFRFGIVPGFAVTDFTVGREKELKIINEWIEKDYGSLMITGQYGEGKSHMIRYIREKCLDAGYMVAYCDIGKESQMAKPRTVLNTLMKNLDFRYKNSDLNVEEIFTLYAEIVNEKKLDYQLKYHWLYGQIISSILRRLTINSHKISTQNGVKLDYAEFRQFIDYLQGDETIRRFSRIPNFSTSANLICNVLSNLGRMSIDISEFTRLKGLLVIFDEGEDITNMLHQRQQRENGKNFLYGLVRTCNNDPILREEKLRRDDNGRYVGEESGLIYSGLNKHPYLYFDESKLKCLFAFVEGDDEVINKVEEYGTQKISLKELTVSEKKQLIEKLSQYHQNCYQHKLQNSQKFTEIILKTLGSGSNTRKLIKLTIEGLDIIYDNPGISYEVLLRSN